MKSASSSQSAQQTLHIACARSAAHAQAWVQMGHMPLAGSYPSRTGFGVTFVSGILDQGYPGTNQDGLALRAYRDHSFKLSKRPRFVVPGKGMVRPDICAAIAALIGILPPQPDHTTHMQLFDRRQREGRKVHLEKEGNEGATLLAWERLSGFPITSELDYYVGLGNMCSLLDPNHPLNIVRPQFVDIELARLKEVTKVADAAKATGYTSQKGPNNVVLISAPRGLYGWDRWFDLGPCVVVVRTPPPQLPAPAVPAAAPAATPATPPTPPVVVHPYLEVCIDGWRLAEDLIGPDGLVELLPQLKPDGWTGTRTRARSPAGSQIGNYEGKEVANLLQAYINKRLPPSQP
jgi:hypothetical protein